MLIIVAVIVIVGTVVFLLLPGDDEAVKSDDDIDPDPVLCGELWVACATGDCCKTGLVCRSRLCQDPGIVTEKLALYIDTSVATSYTGSGTTLFDLSGNERDCTLEGGASVTGSVVVLDGQPQYISTTYLPNLDGAYTYKLWLYDDAPGIIASTSTALISNYGATFTKPHSYLHISSNGTLQASERNSTGVYGEILKGPSIATGEWVHIVSSATATQRILYVNGAQVGSANRPGGSVTSTQAIVIGGNHMGRYQTRRLGPVRIYYDKAPMSAEVTQNFNAENSMPHLGGGTGA